MTDLSRVYKKLLSGKMTPQEAADIIKSSEVKTMINAYINKNSINKLIPYFEEDLQNIYMIINITQFIYNNSDVDTGISDSTYDVLYAIMEQNDGRDVVSVPLAPTTSNIAYHTYPCLRGTLKKIFYLKSDDKRTNPSRQYLDEWKSSMENKIFNKTGKNINLDKEEIYVFPKFDGVSGIFEMNSDGSIKRVLTRGYTEKNEAKDVSHVFQFVETREAHEFNSNYGLKTEVMMTEDNLELYNKTYNTDYKNTRSIVSAIMNSDEYDEKKSKMLHIVPLRVGLENDEQQLATEVFDYPHLRCRLCDRDAISKFAENNRYVDGLRTDGAVIYIIDTKIQDILGRENNKNNYEVAYKFTEEVTFSKLKDVVFNVGLFGRIAPIARIKPVKLKGNTIENISLGSIGRFRNLELRKGDKVKVLYDIIPYLSFDSECEHDMSNDIIEIPDRCPECFEELVLSESGDILSCVNPKCPCKQKGKILNYLNKMNIDELSYGCIDKLYEYGFVKSIKDLYSIKNNKKKIARIDGFGDKSVMSWISEIDSHRDVMDWELVGALGIEGVAKKTFQKIFECMSLDELIYDCGYNNKSYLVTIPSVKDKTADKIIVGIMENLELIEFLQKELNIRKSKGGSKSLFSVCFTKVRDKDKESFVIKSGGSIDDSLTKNTTMLVVPSLSIKSSKVDKAKKYGIEIVAIDDLETKIAEYLI